MAKGTDAPANKTSADGERRHLTVLFCDLVGSTALATRLDPEEWREVVAEYHGAATDAIQRFSGYVAQYLGDGVMALFGWPEAHDNDAERAARAGLAILDAIAKLNERPARSKLSARVGIDSGAVVVGAGVGKEADVFGDAPNIAARVQNAADAGTVMITDATHRLVSGLFVVEDRGAQTLKGIERPLQLYRVIRPSGMRGRFEAAAAAGGLTQFVGREEELLLLMSRWERVLEGEGQVALIIGEAGIGKSRLLQRFHEKIAGSEHTWVEASTGAFFQNTPFYPIVEMLRRGLLAGGNDPPDAIAQLAGVLTHVGLKPAEAIPLIAPLLNLLLPPEYPPSTLAPEQQRRRLLATLVEWVLGSARAQPLVIATEDLHWADPSTLELIQLLVEQGATARLLLLYTARPEFHAPWPLRAHHTQIMLNRLNRHNAHAMVVEITAQKALSDETIAIMVERTAGVPLFVEELTRTVLESGNANLIAREIPATLHDSLMARLNRLGPAKEVAQIGAVIGSEFFYRLLQAVHPIDEEALQAALRILVDAELLYVRGIGPDAMYFFKHALIRDAAYEALLKSRRRELHTHIGRTLEERFPERVESHPEILAHHWSEAGLIAQAARYWRKAGQKAIERSANAEAIAHLTKGLEMLGTLQLSPGTIREEVRLQSSLINPLIATKGYTAPEVERACSRARELCRELGDPPQLFTVFGGLFSVYHNRGEFRAASEMAERMLHLAKNTGDPRLLMWSHYSLAMNEEAQGNLLTARTHLEQSLALYDLRQRGSYGFVQDPYLTGGGFLAHVLHSLGYPDQALEKSQKALSDARELGEPFTLAYAIGATAGLHVRRGEHLKGQELAVERIALCAEHGFLSLSAEGHLWCGWALVQEGGGEEGIARMRQSLAIASGTIQGRLFELYLATAYWQIGRVEEGLSIVETSLTKMSSEGESYNIIPDLYLLRGDLLLTRDSREVEAEQCIYRAIEIARRNGDKTTELRATTSLARVLAKQDCRDEARTMLAEIYNWFTEGFDTADLKDAKALLDELVG